MDDYLKSIMPCLDMTALVTVVTQHGEVVYESALGLRDTANNVPVNQQVEKKKALMVAVPRYVSLPCDIYAPSKLAWCLELAPHTFAHPVSVLLFCGCVC